MFSIWSAPGFYKESYWIACAGEDQQQQEITDPSSRQRGRYKVTNPQLSKKNFKEEEKLVTSPRWVPDTKTECRSQFNFNFKPEVSSLVSYWTELQSVSYELLGRGPERVIRKILRALSC
jgi:hypothetical protein